MSDSRRTLREAGCPERQAMMEDSGRLEDRAVGRGRFREKERRRVEATFIFG